MRRTKDEIISGLRRQNEYVRRHNKELLERTEAAETAVYQVQEALRANLFALAKQYGDMQSDGSILLRIPRPNIAEAQKYAQRVAHSNADDVLVVFTPHTANAGKNDG